MQQALQAVQAGRTTFVIAHRLWTVQHADQIFVLRDGEIVEQAHSNHNRSAHEALLAAGGFYGDVYALQVEAETLETEDAAVEQRGARAKGEAR